MAESRKGPIRTLKVRGKEDKTKNAFCISVLAVKLKIIRCEFFFRLRKHLLMMLGSKSQKT